MRHPNRAIPAYIILLAVPTWAQEAPPTQPGAWQGLVEAHITALDKAFATEPSPDQARVAYKKASHHLQELREHLQVRGYQTSPAKEWIRGANRTWQLNTSPANGSETVFDPDPVVLSPDGGPTLAAIRTIRASIASQITGPIARELFGSRVSQSGNQWGRFYKDVVLQEYPWESFINAGLDWRRSALDPPPASQWRILHPVSGLVAYQGRSGTGTSSTAILGVEVLGLQWNAGEPGDFKATWGLSALFTLRGPGDGGNGYGLMGTYRHFKVGVKWSKLPDGRATSQVLLSLNLVQYLEFKGDKGLTAAIGNMVK